MWRGERRSDIDAIEEKRSTVGTGAAPALVVGLAMGFVAATVLYPPQVATTSVPPLAGMSRQQALQALQQANLVGAPGYRPARGVPAGRVVPGSQSVAAGTEVQPHSVIAFAISVPSLSTAPRPAGSTAQAPPKLPPIRVVGGPVMPPPMPRLLRLPDLPPPVVAGYPYRQAARPTPRQRPPVKRPSVAPTTLAVAPTPGAETPGGASANPAVAVAPATTATVPPTATPAPLSLLEPRAGQEIRCPQGADCAVIVKGTLTSPPPPEAELVIWWRPSTGGIVWFPQLLDGLRVEEDGSWSASVRIGNDSYVPKDGDTVDLAATVADRDTIKRLLPRTKTVFRYHPEGDRGALVNGLVIRTG